MYPPVAVLHEVVDRRCRGCWIGRVRSAAAAAAPSGAVAALSLNDGARCRCPRRTDRRSFPKIAAPTRALNIKGMVLM